MSTRLKRMVVNCAAGLILVAPAAHAIVGGTSGTDGGLLDGEALLQLTTGGSGYICSGSLLAGGEYVLTAAHCVTGNTGSATTTSITISFKGSGVSVTDSNPIYYVDTSFGGYDGKSTAGNDLALIKLPSAITTISGYSLYTENASGQEVLMAGYGDAGTGSSGYANGTYGTLQYGYNTYDATGSSYSKYGITSTNGQYPIYLYDFDNYGGNPSDSRFGKSGVSGEAFIAPGDSGGGSFIDLSGALYLVGVHDFIYCDGVGTNTCSSYGDVAGDTSVYANLAWLDSYLVSAVPEPATYAMFLSGLSLVGLGARRRRLAALADGR
jgi:hypothetical protein